MRVLKFLIPLALFAVLAFFLLRGLSLNPREVPSPLIGKPAPAFTLTTLADPARQITREDLLGKVWVLNVWASWCAPCREEHPLVIAMAKRTGVPVYGLNYKDQSAAAQNWLRQLGDPYAATLVDADGKVGIDWGVYGVPETFVIDKQGTIRHKHIGPLTEEAIRTKVEPLLKELGA
jgi:cytochrome c biogenesis protein CcmG/thiol:disulfide interchange protein DsbE